MSEEDDKRWHLDKKVPIALIVTLVLQTGAFMFWMGSLSQRVDYLEQNRTANAPQGERIIRLETRMENIAEYILEIRNLLRQQREARP